MPDRFGTALTALLLWSVLSVTCLAQDFRVNTRVYDVRPSAGQPDKPIVISRGYSIFHAGKVYDYIDTIGEVTIFEPAQERFILISQSCMMTTMLPLSEIETKVFQGQKHSEEYLRSATGSNNPLERSLVAPIRAQLAPRFAQQYDAGRRRLKLKNEFIQYEVACSTCDSPQIVAAFQQYADWTARLNYVLHPRVFPAPRVALNAVLKEKQVLPTDVFLHLDMAEGLYLRATHSYQWKLDRSDRSSIHHWETLLTRKDMRQVSFEEFQRTLASEEQHARR